jgi:hypothetical protein
MRASVRRIDLTHQAAEVDVWPSLDWLNGELDEPAPRTPRGRGGLWLAMANAVARAREAASPEVASPEVADLREDAEVINLAVEAPHLAYLARVAAGNVDDDEAAVADVIVIDGTRLDLDR